jgi:drug/metabolite transporter (DMT)-like permease
MGWLFLALAIFGFVAMNFIMKLGGLRGYASPFLTTSLFSFASLYCLLFLLFSHQPLNISGEIVWLAIAGGTAGAIAYFFFLHALDIGPYALTVSIYTLTFLNPVIFSIIFWGSPVTTWIALGIMCIIFGLILISLAGSKSEIKKRGLYTKWIIFLAASFCLTGIPQISQAAAVRLGPINLWFYLFLAFFSGSLIFLIFLILKKIPFPAGVLPFGACAAAGSVAGNFFLMRALTRLPEPVVFPINQAAPIMAAVFLSIYYFREKIRPLAFLGFGLALAGIIFLSLR